MSKAVILQHVPHEGPGRITTVFRDFGIPTDIRHIYNGDEVPSDLDDIRMLIVLGGPMGVADVGSEKYPFLAKELELLKRCVLIDRPTLGICLGAQLLAHAGGGKVYPNVMHPPKPHTPDAPSAPEHPPRTDGASAAHAAPEDPGTPMPEIGWLPVTFPFPGGTEPIVMGLYDGAMMFHWHHDTFDLPRLPAPPNAPSAPPPPAGNALLSSSKDCKNQAFRFKNHLFGFQYHFELTESDIEKMLAAQKPDVEKVLGAGGDAKIRTDTRAYYKQYARLGDHIIRNFVQFLKVY